jgi:hypothetical protein
LPITALRETPIAAAIWLQVMPRSTQPRSSSMRSGVQVPGEVPFEAGTRFGAGAMAAGSSRAGTVGGIAGEIPPDGAIDGDMKMASLGAAAGLGRRQGVCPRTTANRETQTSKRKSMRGFRSRSGKTCPDVTHDAGGSRSAEN